MRRILDARYGKSNLKKFMTEQCQHLNPSEIESFINLLKVEFFLMELLARGITPRWDWN